MPGSALYKQLLHYLIYFAEKITMLWADHLISFYKNLNPPGHLPNGVQWLLPFQNTDVLKTVELFSRKFYSDEKERTLLLGINPGRLGGGITGINFTAPKQLSQYCQIEHTFKNGSELSAEFIYEMINAYGGVKKFYSQFFIGAVCPLGFVQNKKNINYYDDKKLQHTVAPFIIESMNALLSTGVNKQLCICIGGEKNFKYLAALNEKQKWFKHIESVPHPRFIMQYRRKQKDEYIQQYIEVLKNK